MIKIKYVNLLVVFFTITMNIYAQNGDGFSRPFYLSGNKIYYTDSAVFDGDIVYTDSIVVDTLIVYVDSVIVDGTLVYTDSNELLSINYPKNLTDNPLFTQAIYRNDYGTFEHIVYSIIIKRLVKQEGLNTSDDKKKYYLFSSDNRYINYTLLEKAKNDDLYTQYEPVKKDNETCSSFSQRQLRKMMTWIQQEMDKGLMVSVGAKDKKTYIAKSFSSSL